MDTERIIQTLLDAEPLRKPVLQNIIESLHLPAASRGLDIGCGIGLPAMLLAEAIGPEGHVTCLDILPELLSFGEQLVAEKDLSERIKFQEGDINGRQTFPDNTFDWAWSVDCVGYPAGELTTILNELMRVVKPGGDIIIIGWSSQQILPGHPLLEARLNATCSSYLPFLKGVDVDRHFLRVSYWFENVGLKDVRVRTFVGELQAPLTKDERKALVSLFEMLWGVQQPEASPEDWMAYQHLCTLSSADFILDQPGYYAFFTHTLFQGKVPTGVG